MKENTFGTNIHVPSHYQYRPKEDITVFELASIIPAFNKNTLADVEYFIEGLSENMKRHFSKL